MLKIWVGMSLQYIELVWCGTALLILMEKHRSLLMEVGGRDEQRESGAARIRTVVSE